MEITIQKPMENIIYASSHEIYTLFLLIIKARVNCKLMVCYLSYRALKSDNKVASQIRESPRQGPPKML